MVSTHLKNIRQNGIIPIIGVKIKNIWNNHPENNTFCLIKCEKLTQCVTTWAARAGNIPGILQELKLTLADGLQPNKSPSQLKRKIHLNQTWRLEPKKSHLPNLCFFLILFGFQNIYCSEVSGHVRTDQYYVVWIQTKTDFKTHLPPSRKTNSHLWRKKKGLQKVILGRDMLFPRKGTRTLTQFDLHNLNNKLPWLLYDWSFCRLGETSNNNSVVNIEQIIL